MADEYRSIAKGDRTMSRGFIAQYAAEAAMQTAGVAGLAAGGATLFREALGIQPESSGVKVFFKSDAANSVSITVYPIIYFGRIIPEVAWSIQENVKSDVERFTGLIVDAVDVHVIDIIPAEES
jgi:uncharacterized alkaline shock family protein YloU